MLTLVPQQNSAAQPPRRVWVATRDSHSLVAAMPLRWDHSGLLSSTSVTHASYPSGITNCSYGYSASGTHARFGLYTSGVAVHSQDLSHVLTLMKLGACNRQACGVRGSWQQRSFACLGGPSISLDRSAVSSEYFTAVNAGPLSGVQSWKPEPQHPGPTCPKRCANSFSAGKGWSEMISVVMSLCFAFWEPVAVFPSEGTELPRLTPNTTCEGVSKHVETFPSSWHSLKWGSPSQDICLFIFVYLLSYIILRRLVCLFGSLGSSASIQKVFCGNCSTSRYIFYVIVGKKLISLSYSSYILKVPPKNVLIQIIFCKIT